MTDEVSRTPRIVVLTGAGISAESGIATFRDANGLWNDHRVEDVASPEGFVHDPALVHRFYDARRRQARDALPNPAHYALADLARELGPQDGRSGVLVVTQNVDDLHERAGSAGVLHVHGRLDSALCTRCGQRHPWHEDLGDAPACPSCGTRALRPDIVWFGEAVQHWDEIPDAVARCETLIVIGTSAQVWPAAGLIDLARSVGARTVLANAEAHDDLSLFDDVRLGPAGEVVPELVKELLDLDHDPDDDWSEASPAHLRTSVYIDAESVLADGRFDLDDPEARLPRLIGGARDAVADLSQDFDVVIVASAALAESPGFARFWQWYKTQLGSYRGHLADQLLLTGSPASSRGWDFFIRSDRTDAPIEDWVGEVVTLGPKGTAGDWAGIVDHVRRRAFERPRPGAV